MLAEENTRILKIFTCKMVLTKISIKTTFQQWYKWGVCRHYHILVMKHSGYVCRNLVIIGVLLMCCVMLYLWIYGDILPFKTVIFIFVTLIIFILILEIKNKKNISLRTL